jgi:hypothetical protein
LKRENIFKPTIGYKGLHQDSNNNGAGIVKLAISNHSVVKNTMFPHTETFISTPGALLMRIITTRLITY